MERPVFPMPAEGGGRDKFPNFRARGEGVLRSHPGGACLPATVPCGFPLQDRTRSQVRLQQFFRTLSISDWPSEPVLPTWLLLSAEAPCPTASGWGSEQQARSLRQNRAEAGGCRPRMAAQLRKGWATSRSHVVLVRCPASSAPPEAAQM